MMTTPAPTADAVGILAAVARVLAANGRDGAAEVARIVRDRLGVVGVVLHDADGEVISGVAVPHQRGAARTVDVAVRAGGRLHGWLTVASAAPMTAEQAAACTAVADLLALSLEAAAARAAADLARDDLARALLDHEADCAALAATLGDRVGGALVALGYSAALVAAGRADPAGLSEPVQAALTAFRLAQRDLHARSLEGGLRAALVELAKRRKGDWLDDGLPVVPVELRATDPALDALPPVIAVTVERVAEASLRVATGRIRLTARVERTTVKLQVDSADIAFDAGELGRWERRVRALGGHLRSGPDGVELSLPAVSEGSHDDRPDL